MPKLLRRTALAAGAITGLVGAAAIAAAPAGAATGTGPSTAGVARAALLSGYTTVAGAPVPLPSNSQVSGTALCPAGTVPLGGGVLTDSKSTLVSINSSFPIAGGWAVKLSNVSDAPAFFEAQVECARKPAHYKVVKRQAVRNPAATHTTASATCPTGSRPLGGGAASSSGSSFVTLSSSAPAGKQSWKISENNATGRDASVTVFALCGSVQAYTVVHGPVLSIPGRSIASLGAMCPPGRVATGGGTVISSTSVGAYLNLSATADSKGWISFVTNTAAAPFNAGTTVVCAGIPE